MLRFIDLFAGVGGFHLAMKQAFPLSECVYACEWDMYARTTYLANFGDCLEKAGALFDTDLTKVDPCSIPDHDILLAGFPCQPFSIAGPQQGFKHPTQGTLFFNLLQIIKSKKPPVLLLENVKNLITHDKGNTFKVVLDSLTEAGYQVSYKVLSGLHGGIPQNRERVVIVGFLTANKFDFPSDMPELTPLFGEHMIKSVAEDRFYIKDTGSASSETMLKGVNQPEIVYQMRRSYVRANKSGLCPTLTANMGTGGNNVPLVLDSKGVRKLTPRECFNLNGFPEVFILPSELSDSRLYKQAGNSIIVPTFSRVLSNIFSDI